MDHRILIALIIGLTHVAITWAVPQKDLNSLSKSTSTDPTKAKIMKQINKVNDDGSYTFGYESDDGSFRVETRSKDGVVKGKYGFVDSATGELKVTEYTAGEKAAGSENVESEDYPEEPRVSPTQSASQDQSTSAQTPRATKVSRPAPNNSFDEIDVDDGPKQFKYNTSPGPTPVVEAADEDDEFRTFGAGAQQAYQARRQIESRQGEPQGGRGPSPQQFFSQQPNSRQFDGERPRYVPTNDFNDQPQFGGPGPQGIQYSGGPGLSQFSRGPQFSQGGLGAGGPQQFNAPVLRSPQQSAFGPGPSPAFDGPASGFGRGPSSFGGPSPAGGFSGQYDISAQQPSRPSPTPQTFRNAPEDYASLGAGGGRFDEPQQRINFGAGGQGPALSPFSGFGAAGGPSGRQFEGGAGPGSRPQYVPNYELDGYSDDADQDGFVDPAPGSQGKAAQAAEKQGVIKTPEGEKIGTTSGDYTPQALGPLQAGRAFNPQQQQLSPEQIQQIYGGQPQFQGGRPFLQQGGAGGEQFLRQVPQQFSPQQAQFLAQQQQGGAGGFPRQFQGFPGGAFPQQQLAGFGPGPQQTQSQFAPQAQQQQIPQQFLQQAQQQPQIPQQFFQPGQQQQLAQRQQFNPQSGGGQGQQGAINSPNFPFDFAGYQSGPGGFPSAIPQGAAQASFLGAQGQGSFPGSPQGQGSFPGGPQGQAQFLGAPGQAFPGGLQGQGSFPGGPQSQQAFFQGGQQGGFSQLPLQGQQIPQQFLAGGGQQQQPQAFSRQGTPFGGSSKESDEGEAAKTT